MLKVARCTNCFKQLEVSIQEFDGKSVWINVNLTRFYKHCKSCHHVDEMKGQFNFCSVECFKIWVTKIDEVVASTLFLWESVRDD